MRPAIPLLLNGALWLTFLGLAVCACASEPADAVVRPPAVAGKFYPADRGKLEGAIKAYLAEAVPARGERPIGILAPHAGYLFSGQIAADAWAQAAGNDVDLVVILGTNHTVAPFDSVSVFQGRGYATPLGVATVDQEVAQRLVAGGFTYKPDAHMTEHSEEVQVPFVQVLFPKAKIVTAVVGKPDIGLATRFGEALARAVKDRKVLVVASSDLSHYPPYEEACAADRATLTAVASLDPKALAEAVGRTEAAGRPGLATSACGEGAIMAAMAASKALGATRGIVLSYANSGDTAVGERDRVVGYGAVAFTAGPGGADTKALAPPVPGKVGELTDADKAYLLKLARATVERFLTTDTLPLPRPASPALRAKQGAFVTLNKGGDLRGCIGHMAEDTPLCQVVARMALAAAFEDTRFSPVQPAEVPSLEVEISVLTPLAPVEGPGAVVVGRDGVVIRKGGRSAVFLPQVAPEQGWSREEMLDHLCQKAGLPADCWRSGCEFLTFRAIVFGEKKVSGERGAGSGKK
jgi:MEMO1 family protein